MSIPSNFSLVLGWWGARWYIHLWVLKYFEEQNIIPAQIVWTSMGALVWGAWAIGLPVQQIIHTFKSISRTSLFDVDIKTASIQWALVEKLLEKTIGTVRIEDIHIPFSCTATCLEDGKSTLFESWLLIDALRASISVPGLFSPQKLWDCTYVDGWLTANLPVQYATHNSVIAISAARAQDLEIETTSLRRKREVPKNPLTINKEIVAKGYNLLLRTQEDQAIQLCDKEVKLVRPYNQLRLLDMDKIDEGMQMGYEEAKKTLWALL